MKQATCASVLFAGILAVHGSVRGASYCEWCNVDFLAPAPDSQTMPLRGPQWSNGEAETNKVDVLLVFDKTAKTWVLEQGYRDCEEFANEAVLELNAGLANTGLDEHFTFRLAGAKVAGVSFNTFTASSLALKIGAQTGVKAREKAVVQRIRALRDEVKADLVALVSDGFQGEAFGSSVMFSNAYWSEKGLDLYKEMAYCAVSVSAIRERFTLLHELGHLMGAGHSDRVVEGLAPGPQLFDCSAGYYFKAGGKRYATVMSSEHDGHSAEDAVRMPFFSSPDYTMLVEGANGSQIDSGVAVGTENNDNSRTLRTTYPYVANFRVAIPAGVLPEETSDRPADGLDAPVITAYTPTRTIENGDVLYSRVGVTLRIKMASETESISISSLPPGLSFNEPKKLIYGVPAKAGNYEIAITAANATSKSSLKFAVSVAELAEWSIGTYYGWAQWEGVHVPVKVVTTAAGRVKGAFNVNGRNIFFTSTRYLDNNGDDMGATSLGATVKVRVSGTDIRKLTLRLSRKDFASRNGATLSRGVINFAEIDGEALEDLWMDENAGVTMVSKKRIVSVTAATPGETGLCSGDKMQFMLTDGGRGKFRARMSGTTVYGSGRFARLGLEDGSDFVELAQMPVIIAPAAASPLKDGYAAMAMFRIAVDNATGSVSGLKLTCLEKLSSEGNGK